MKNLLIIAMMSLVSCKNSPFKDDGIRDASDRGEKISNPLQSNTTSSTSTTTTTTTTKVEMEKLLTREEVQALTFGELFNTFTEKLALQKDNEGKSVLICDEEKAEFDKTKCIALLEPLIITTKNIDLLGDELLKNVVDDKQSIIETIKENFKKIGEFEEKLKKVSETKLDN